MVFFINIGLIEHFSWNTKKTFKKCDIIWWQNCRSSVPLQIYKKKWKQIENHRLNDESLKHPIFPLPIKQKSPWEISCAFIKTKSNTSRKPPNPKTQPPESQSWEMLVWLNASFQSSNPFLYTSHQPFMATIFLKINCLCLKMCRRSRHPVPLFTIEHIYVFIHNHILVCTRPTALFLFLRTLAEGKGVQQPNGCVNLKQLFYWKTRI